MSQSEPGQWAGCRNADNGQGDDKVCSHALRHAYVENTAYQRIAGILTVHTDSMGSKYAKERQLQSV